MLVLPPVYAILDGSILAVRGISMPVAAEAMVDGGIRLLQIRWKDSYTRAAYDDAVRIAHLCRRSGASLVINDRADIALLLGTGLHVGQDDLRPVEARRVLPQPSVLGLSTHNEEQFTDALGQPVDYIALGPIYGTVSKANPDPVVGLEALRRLRAASTAPLVAIGGITRRRAPEVWRAGANSVAVIADLYPEDCTAASLRARAADWTRIANEHCN